MPPAWFIVVGGLLMAMALAGSVLKRLPLTSAMFYLAAGAWLGPWGLDLLRIDLHTDAATVESLAEVAVLVSLFTAGLKMRLPVADRRWQPPLLLATVAMVSTIAGITALGVFVAGLPLGAAVLLGAILSPTDPVLASDVQVAHEHDAEPVRVALTGEAGLNDGAAFPFVMLGLGLLGHHELGSFGARWFGVDLAWAIGGGLLVGAACGAGVGKLVLYLRRVHREAVGFDEFLALGLIALSYGIALVVHTYGFLAVFAAGLSVRRIERQHSAESPAPDVAEAARGGDEEARDPATAPAYMARAVLAFNEQLERLGEVAVVVVVGAMLTHVQSYALGFTVAALLFLVIRPLATAMTLSRTTLSGEQRLFIAWFGVRGIGSIYYLAYALTHGITAATAQVMVDVTLTVITASIVVHGVSVTPLMKRYSARADAQ
jgi:NhaP-type Na+/H+ or K+/H+ antiporter